MNDNIDYEFKEIEMSIKPYKDAQEFYDCEDGILVNSRNGDICIKTGQGYMVELDGTTRISPDDCDTFYETISCFVRV